jgi:hypothetical protein
VGVPRICELVTPAELGAIVGAAATLTDPEVTVTGPGLGGWSCGYDFPPAYANAAKRHLVLSMTRYDNPAAARRLVDTGPTGSTVAGLGDAAAAFVCCGNEQLNVLVGSDVLTINFDISTANAMVPTPTLEAIAQAVLAHLRGG